MNLRQSGLVFVGLLGCVIGGCNKPSPTATDKPAPAPVLQNSAAEAAATPPAPAAAASLLDFEGEMGITISGANTLGRGQPAPGQSDTRTLSLFIKSQKARVPIPGEKGPTPDGNLIFRFAEKKVFFVMDAPKQAIVFDLDKAAEQFKAFSGRAPQAATTPTPPQISKTGNKDQVLGITCEIWNVQLASGEKAAVCATEAGLNWFQLPLSGAPADVAWLGELFDGKHFPLRLIAYGKSGKEEGRIELTRLERKAVPDESFEVPAGYSKATVADLMGAAMLGVPGRGPKLPLPPVPPKPPKPAPKSP